MEKKSASICASWEKPAKANTTASTSTPNPPSVEIGRSNLQLRPVGLEAQEDEGEGSDEARDPQPDRVSPSPSPIVEDYVTGEEDEVRANLEALEHDPGEQIPISSKDAIAALPEDAQLVIFSHVGNVKDLFRFAMTCRSWVHRFTDPGFLRGLFKGNRACLSGFFFQETAFKLCKPMVMLRTTQGASVSAPTFILSPWSPLFGPTKCSLTAFVPDHDGTFNYAEPLESRSGIVLMQLVPRNFNCTNVSVLLSICNPITGDCHFLPPLETPHSSPPRWLDYSDFLWDLGTPQFSPPREFEIDYVSIGLQVTMNAIITAADNSNLDGVQLLLITTHGSRPDYGVYLHSYSVGTRSWSTPTRWLEGSNYSVRDRAAVVHRGVAHWLCGDRATMDRVCLDDENLYKLSVEVGTMRLSLTKLPFHAGGSRLLRVSKDGMLSVACIYVMHVTLWTQQECGEEGDDTHVPWLRTVIRITPDPNYRPLDLSATCRQSWFGFDNGSLLILNRGSIFILDLENKVMEEVKVSFERKTNMNGDLTTLPYEMDLVKFFVLRLSRMRKEPRNL